MNEGGDSNSPTNDGQPAPVYSPNSGRSRAGIIGSRRYKEASSNRESVASENLANNPNTPEFFRQAVLENAPAPSTPRKSPKKLIIIIAVIVLLALIGLAVFLFIKPNIGVGQKSFENETLAGEVNLDMLFDENAPIPFSNGGAYGYVNPNNGEWVIQPNYEEAGPFYGNYARVVKGGKIYVINRNGRDIVVRKNIEKVEYDISYNIWIIGDDVYNGAMEKINPEDTKAAYASYGYIVVVPNVKPGENSTGSPYLMNVAKKETVFQCKAPGCAMVLTKGLNDNETYLVLHEYGGDTKVTNIKNNTELISVPVTSHINVVSEGVLMERDVASKKTIKYITINRDAASISTTRPSVKDFTGISMGEEYVIEDCGGIYGIRDKDGNVVVDCKYDEIRELPELVYKRASKLGKDLVFLLDGKAHLFDMRTKKEIKEYEQTGIEMYDESVFARLYSNLDKSFVCNILNPDLPCIEVSAHSITPYGTYFRVNGKIYSFGLKEIIK